MDVKKFLQNDVSRRQFLESSAHNAAGMACGVVALTGAATSAGLSAGNCVSVAVIGVRQQGQRLATSFAGIPGARVTMLCDVDGAQLSAAVHAVEKVQAVTPRCVRDFRRVLDEPGIDAVVIATPDHWHAPMAILACQAGKDVYVEPPVAHNIIEGVQMIEAARKHGRVVQVGLQQRSSAHFQSAIEYLRSGELGEVRMALAWAVHRRKPLSPAVVSSPPSDVDYDMWLGPAATRPFQATRFHHNWRWFWDYGAGELGDWGVHMLDVVRWGLGLEWPDRVSATAGPQRSGVGQDTPETLVVNFSFPETTVVWEHRQWSTRGIEGRSVAAAFYGERGTLIVDRGGWKVYDNTTGKSDNGQDDSSVHHQAFLDAVRNRTTSPCDIADGHVSTGLCHLGNIAARLERDIHFDANQLEIVNDAAATRLLARDYSTSWPLPVV